MTTRPSDPEGPNQAPDQRSDQRPGGSALPSQDTPQGVAQANELRDELIAATWPALGNTVDDYERPIAGPALRLTPQDSDLIDGRMKRMSWSERADLESMRRVEGSFSADYDALPYGVPRGHDPLPYDLAPDGVDGLTPYLTPPRPQLVRSRGWYDKK